MSPELNLARSSMFRPSSYWNCLLFDLPKPNLLFHLTLLLPIHPSFFWQKDLSIPQISSITPLTQGCKGLSTACRAKTKLKAFSLSPHSFFLPHVGNPATLPPLIVSSTVLVTTHIDLSHAAFIPLAIVKTVSSVIIYSLIHQNIYWILTMDQALRRIGIVFMMIIYIFLS